MLDVQRTDSCYDNECNLKNSINNAKISFEYEISTLEICIVNMYVY